MAEQEIKSITVHPCTATYNALCTGLKVNPATKIEFKISVSKDISTQKERVELQMYFNGVAALRQTMNATVLALMLLNQISICAISDLISQD